MITAGASLINDGIFTRFMVAAAIQTANFNFGLAVTKKLAEGQGKER